MQQSFITIDRVIYAKQIAWMQRFKHFTQLEKCNPLHKFRAQAGQSVNTVNDEFIS